MKALSSNNDNQPQQASPGAPSPIRKPGGVIRQAGRLGMWIDKLGIVFALGIILSMLILIQEVFLRYVMNAPTIWAHETTIFLCAIAFIFGGLYCTARDSHIRVVILYDLVTGRAKRLLNALISLVSACASAFFAWASWVMVDRAMFAPDGSFRMETSGSAWNPPTPAMLKAFLLIVLVALACQFLLLAINYARGKGEEDLSKQRQSDT